MFKANVVTITCKVDKEIKRSGSEYLEFKNHYLCHSSGAARSDVPPEVMQGEVHNIIFLQNLN